jgi:hypothetical protein
MKFVIGVVGHGKKLYNPTLSVGFFIAHTFLEI